MGFFYAFYEPVLQSVPGRTQIYTAAKSRVRGIRTVINGKFPLTKNRVILLILLENKYAITQLQELHNCLLLNGGFFECADWHLIQAVGETPDPDWK